MGNTQGGKGPGGDTPRAAKRAPALAMPPPPKLGDVKVPLAGAGGAIKRPKGGGPKVND